MYFKHKDNLIKQINILLSKHKLIGIKAEFEAEGSSFDDVSNLRGITNYCNTKLFVKIGGAEALNDIYKCLEIGVDGIIAPMIESKFAVYKFVDFFRKKKLKKIPHLSINIETKTAYDNLDEILKYTDGYIKNITVGRSDLSKSFFRKNLYPDSDFISNIIINIAKKVKKYKMTLTVGGSLSNKTIQKYNKSKNLLKLINKMETRKVILPTSNFMSDIAINEALNFENYYILLKNEIYEQRADSDKNRLSTLITRK
jgi:4-hydroxy-2-oxoheptanedioate aldolase